MLSWTWSAARAVARWYGAGLAAAASVLVCPELMAHLDEDARQTRYAYDGIDELTAWLHGLPITD